MTKQAIEKLQSKNTTGGFIPLYNQMETILEIKLKAEITTTKRKYLLEENNFSDLRKKVKKILEDLK